jgi:glutaredoxin 3
VGCPEASRCLPVSDVLIFTTRWCPFCIRAKALLDRKGIVYQEIAVDGDAEARQQMAEAAGQTSVPQIWIGGQHIGGCDELYGLERSGALDPLLAVQAG